MGVTDAVCAGAGVHRRLQGLRDDDGSAVLDRVKLSPSQITPNGIPFHAQFLLTCRNRYGSQRLFECDIGPKFKRLGICFSDTYFIKFITYDC